MALNPSKSSNLEQLALKGLKDKTINIWTEWPTQGRATYM